MIKAIYPGTFDPVTYGHIDIIERASRLVDELVVGVLINNKKSPMFTTEERVEMIKHVTADLPNVKVVSFDGLLVDFAKQEGARSIVRGLRSVTDFDYELQNVQTNRILNADVDTIFLTASLEYSYLSSSVVREVAAFGGDLTAFVPEYIKAKLIDRIKEMNK